MVPSFGENTGCMCVCVYDVCLLICMYVHVYRNMHICTWFVYASMYVYGCVCNYVPG